MAVVFWVSIGAIAYTYFGYYALLRLVRLVRPRPVRSGPYAPRVSIIVPVHNGADVIGAKLENLCGLAYPEGALEILVASDGSTDGTEAAVRAVADPRVTLVALPERGGKEAAQRAALAQATGDVCVFTDAEVRLPPETLSRLLAPFADATVGAVTSHDVIDGESGEGAYVRYEMALRDMESAVGSVVALSGSLFAVRRALCDTWPEDVPSDFFILLQTVLRGYRGVHEPRATAVYGTVHTAGGEFQRKVRTVQRGIACLMRAPDVLLPWRTGFFAVQIFSHKLLRWSVPVFLCTALLSNLALAGAPRYAALLAAQGVFYALAVAALLLPGVQATRLARLACFFLLTNASIAVAWWRYLLHGTVKTWQPTAR